MIFSRKIEASLYEWQAKHNRKPLILRGARHLKKSRKLCSRRDFLFIGERALKFPTTLLLLRQFLFTLTYNSI